MYSLFFLFSFFPFSLFLLKRTKGFYNEPNEHNTVSNLLSVTSEFYHGCVSGSNTDDLCTYDVMLVSQTW